MTPSVFRFERKADKARLYVSEFSTADGLALFPPDESVEIVEVATESPMQVSATTVSELMKQLVDGLDGELIDITIKIGRLVQLGTHDDGECHFEFSSEAACLDIARQIAPDQLSDQLIDCLIKNPEYYIWINGDQLVRFDSFDAYLAAS